MFIVLKKRKKRIDLLLLGVIVLFILTGCSDVQDMAPLDNIVPDTTDFLVGLRIF